MKLAAVILASCLAFSGSARADDYNGPPGDYPVQEAPVQEARLNVRAGGPQRPELRAMLMAQFDRNHDGRLEPNERKRAAHALRKMARMLMRGERGQRGGMRGQIIQRYDLNGDGNVGPREMPPAMADRLRRFDRNGDGWLDGRDQ